MKIKALLWLGVILFSFPLLAQEEEADEVRYIDLTPAFVANYGPPGKMRYIKAEVSLRVSSQDGYRKVIHHAPSLRHEIVMFLSRQTDETMADSELKEQLRLDALSALQSVMQQEEGSEIVEDLLFSTFFVQR